MSLFLENEPTRVRAMRPTCYPGWILVEVQAVLVDGAVGLCNFLYGPSGGVLIDGTSAAIHRLNESGVLSLREETSTVADYLTLFCSAVHGPAGRFKIIESIDDLPRSNESGEKVSIEPAASDALSRVQVMREGHAFVATAIVLYTSSLFLAKFTISDDGMVVMTESEPLAVLPIAEEEFRLPFRLVRGANGSARGNAPATK